MPARKRVFLVCLGTAIPVLLTFLIAFWLPLTSFREDFSKWPPARVYEMVLSKPPSSDISRIQVSGRHYFIKRWAWLRVQGNASALASLESIAKEGEHLTWTEMQQEMKAWRSPNPHYDSADHAAVGWSDLNRVAHPVCYRIFLGNNDPWLWHCFFVFDHANNTVYMQVDGG
jgi:hypothetical protein